MLQIVSKYFLVLSLNLILSIPLYAQLVEQADLDFPIKTEALIKGETHFYFEIISPRKLGVQYPEAFELDSLSLIQENNAKIVLTKSVTVINKPVGFFDQDQLTDEKYMEHVMGEQKLKRLSPSSYLVTVPGTRNFSYKMQNYFDADDISTLPNSKVIRAVSAAKKLDVISQGASAIKFTEFTNYTQYNYGGVSVSSYIPLKENKTLIISYQMWAVKKAFVKSEILKKNVMNEITSVKELMNSF